MRISTVDSNAGDRAQGRRGRACRGRCDRRRVSAAGSAVAAPVQPGLSDQAAYNHAFDALKNSDYTGAIAQFKDFLRHYPQSALADNAQYWLGEGYYVTRDYDDAAIAFRAVVRAVSAVPQGSGRAAQARLRAVRAQSTWPMRAQRLARWCSDIPGTDAAKLAAERLTKIPPDAP